MTWALPAWLACGAGLAMALEVIGAGAGERKRMRRRHIGVIVVVSGLGAMVLGAAGGMVALGLVLGLALLSFASIEGDELLGERAAIALALAGSAALAVGSSGPLTVVAFAGAAVVAEGALLARGTNATVEAAAKALFVGGAGVLLLAAGAVFPAAVGATLTCAALMLMLGVPPVHGARVDVAHGAPPSVFALSSVVLFVLGESLARAVAAVPWEAQVVVVMLVGVGVPLLALAQTSIRRVFSLLGAAQLAPVVVAGILGVPARASVAVACVGIVAIALASAQWPTLQRPSSTWEDVSGAGRDMPWRAGLVVCACGCASGLPPSLGAAVRHAIAGSASGDLGVLSSIILVSGVGLLALPVVRLALFLFGKTPRTPGVPPVPRAATIALGLVVGVAVVGGLAH